MERTWYNFVQHKNIFLEKNYLINKSTNIFTAGSCFAVEIRKELKSKNYNIYPKYFNINFDAHKSSIGSLPVRDNINHYNTYSILYELMRFHNLFKQNDNDYWIINDNWFGNQKAFQDPYRRAIYSNNQKELFKTINKINHTMFDALTNSEVYIFTLGLTEVWKKKDNDMIACMNPGYAQGGGFKETFFYSSSFDDNLSNLREIVKLSKKINNKINIIFTVSPVPLGRTFRNVDVVIANEESKAIPSMNENTTIASKLPLVNAATGLTKAILKSLLAIATPPAASSLMS